MKNCNLQVAKKFWSTYKQMFNNHAQTNLGVLSGQEPLVTDASEKVKYFQETFF